MTIALVVTNLEGGGAERTLLRLAAGLGRRGQAVHLILLEHRIAHEVPPGISLHALTAPGVPIGKGSLGIIGAALRLRRLYRRLGLGRECATLSTLPFCDRVVAAARIPNAWFRIANTYSVEAQALPTQRRRARRLARYRRLYDGRNLVAVSDGVASDLLGPIGLRRARIERIRNGVDAASIRVRAAESDPEIPREPFVIHVGRFAAQKRHDLLLDAWVRARLPHRLVLLTAPDPRLDALIASRGLAGRVVVAGFRQNPYPWIRAAELLVLLGPRGPAERAPRGDRVRHARRQHRLSSGPREILAGERARGLVPCGDPDALAQAIVAALRAPPPSAPLPEDFTEAHMVAAYERLLAGT